VAVSNIELRVDGRNAVNQLNRVNKAAGTLQGTVNKLVGAFAGIQAAKFVFFKTAELETQTRSLKVLTGSLGNAQKIIKELQQFGAVTPFTSAELIETAKRLKAFGFETEKIVDVTKRLGDIAGATGADLGGIATAFGQIQAKGRLQGEELLQLQERGVDLQGTLRKEYGLTAEEFQKALSKGQIGADAVNFALEKLTETGGKYAEGAFAQSDTLSGKLSTLQDNIDNLARTLGSVLSPAIKGILDQAIGSLNALNQLLAMGARAQDFGMTQKQRVKILRQAEEEAKEIALIRGGGKLDPAVFNQLKMQREKDLIEMYGFKTGQIQPELAAPDIPRIRPDLGGGTGAGAGKQAGANRTIKERVDMSQKLHELNKQLFDSDTQLTELQKISLEFQIEKQEILERNLLPREEEIALLKATAGFEADLLSYREDQIRLQEQAADLAERERKKREDEEKRRLEADPAYQMQQQLEELLNAQNQVAAGATAIGNAFSNSFRAVITGSKSAQEALADMMSAVAEHFMDMAAKIIAQQIAMILYGTIMKALGIGTTFGQQGNQIQNDFGNFFRGATSGTSFAEGGFVSGPTRALIGEGGEPEYVIPESKMRESMARYSRGARGSSVIPEAGGSGTSGESSGTAVAAPIDVRYTVERINSVDYVTADQFQAGMRQAANQGAKQGEQQTLKRLQMSSSTRKRVGM